jgi:hypothetical protein
MKSIVTCLIAGVVILGGLGVSGGSVSKNTMPVSGAEEL